MRSQEWIVDEFNDIDLGDLRLNKRLITISNQFYSNPESTIPSACEGWTNSKACYRFFKNEKVDHKKIFNTHRLKSIENFDDDDIVLLIQDTTFINYVNHHKTTGLGRIGKNKHSDSSGLIMHSSFALTEDGLPIGLMGQKIYARPFLEDLKHRNRHATPIEEKESFKWVDVLRDSIDKLTRPERFITIADREADIYELMLEVEKLQSNFLIRACKDRPINKKQKRSPVKEKIWPYMEKQKIIGKLKIKIHSKNNGNKLRDVELKVKLGSFTIHAPQQMRNYVLKESRPIKVYAIFLQENEYKKSSGEEPIEWMLLTNIPTEDLEDAATRVKWYKCRWRIELLHKIMKTGYQIEKCRLLDAKRLIKYLTIVSIISFRVLYITYLQQEEVEFPIEAIFSKEEIVILKIKAGQRNKNKKLSASDGTAMLAKMGGFFNRKSDSYPGRVNKCDMTSCIM